MATDSLVTQENPRGYWCRRCGRSRAYAEQHCSSGDCADRRREEDYERDNPRDYSRFLLFRSAF